MSDTPDIPDFEALIEHELSFFFSEEITRAFEAVRIPPTESVQMWQYGSESHQCWIIAADATHQIVYCKTGFGPSFAWASQNRGATDLGTDGQWCAYLVEAFAGMWKGRLPENFMLMGPGEREQLRQA
jgi:hypothetical protein